MGVSRSGGRFGRFITVKSRGGRPRKSTHSRASGGHRLSRGSVPARVDSISQSPIAPEVDNSIITDSSDAETEESPRVLRRSRRGHRTLSSVKSRRSSVRAFVNVRRSSRLKKADKIRKKRSGDSFSVRSLATRKRKIASMREGRLGAYEQNMVSEPKRRKAARGPSVRSLRKSLADKRRRGSRKSKSRRISRRTQRGRNPRPK